MDVWLFHHEEHERLYNCTSYNVDDVPLEQRQHVYVGYALIGLALLFEAAYIPVACVLYSKIHLSTCYKLMFYVAVCDILSMLVVGIVTGVFAIQGVVYCSIPEFNHLMGLFASFFWFVESSASVILAVNRCADLIIPKVNRLFSGGFWSAASIAAPTAFGLYFVLFTKPCFFNGLFACWMYNPHVGYLTDLGNSYENRPHDIHNWSLAVILIGLYITFFVGFGIQQRKYPTLEQGPAWKSRKTLFAQVFIISAVNAIGSSTYDALQLVQVSPSVTIFASFMWLSANGVPGVMYVTMNETIRNGCLELFGIKKAKGARVSSTNFAPVA